MIRDCQYLIVITKTRFNCDNLCTKLSLSVRALFLDSRFLESWILEWLTARLALLLNQFPSRMVLFLELAYRSSIFFSSSLTSWFRLNLTVIKLYHRLIKCGWSSFLQKLIKFGKHQKALNLIPLSSDLLSGHLGRISGKTVTKSEIDNRLSYNRAPC